MSHITEEQLVAYALDDAEAGTRAAVDAHVETCGACRAALGEIRATLDHAAAVEVPERGDDYGARVWASIERRLSESRSIEGSHDGTSALQHRTSAPQQRTSAPQHRTPAPQHRTPAPRHSGTSAHLPVRLMPWLAAAATVMLVVGAYWLGRHDAGSGGTRPSTATTVASAPSAGTSAIRERVMLAALGEHFDRTERTLVELVNSQPGRRVDISAEQAWARDLLEANRLYRQATGRSAPSLSLVLEDLEPVLLEIANSPSQLTSDEFESLRDRIESRSLVFKVRVTGADVRARQRALMRRGELQS